MPGMNQERTTSSQTKNVDSQWSEFLSEFKEAIGPFEFQVFANELELLKHGEDTITICVPRTFHKNWLEDKHGSCLASAFHQAYSEDMDLEITVDGETDNDTETSSPEPDNTKQTVNRSDRKSVV